MRIQNIVAITIAICIAAFGFANSCSATNPPAKASEQVATAPVRFEDRWNLMQKVQKDIAEVRADIPEVASLSEKMALAGALARFEEIEAMLLSTQQEAAHDPQPEKKDPRSYTQKAGQEFSALVPVYAGNEVETPVGFGSVYASAMTQAEAERPDVATVKVAVVNRLQEAHTRAVLEQDALHIPEYTALLQAAPRSDVVLETIQQERLKDEAAIEKLANPSFWTCVKWWWNS